MKGSLFKLHRLTIVKLAIAAWVAKGALLYLLWSDRDFTSTLDEGGVNIGRGKYGLTILSLLIFGAQVAAIVFWGRRAFAQAFSQRPIFSLAIIYFTTMSLIGAVYSGHGNIWTYWSVFALPFLFVAALDSPEEVVDHAAMCVGLLILASLPFALMFPEQAFWRSNERTVVAFAPRFVGLTPHANAMGAAASFVLIVALHRLTGRRRLIWIGVSAAALLASQSKTAILAVALVGLIYFATALLDARRQRDLHAVISCVLAAMAVFSPWWIPMLSGIFGDDRISTLTGRTDIWRVALELWEQSPLVGNGPEVFDAYFRRLTRLTGAESAHNQTLDTLVSSGLLGFSGLFLLLLASAARVITLGDPRRRALVVSLLVFLLVRFMTEATLKFNGPGVVYIIYFALFALMLADDTRPRRVSA